MNDLKNKLEDVVSTFEKKVKIIDVIRPSPELLRNTLVEQNKKKVPVHYIASISVQQQSLIVKPWDLNNIKNINTALIQNQFNTRAGKDTLEVILPAPSQERRQELSKIIKVEAEQFKVQIRHIRKQSIDQIKEETQSKSNEYYKKIESVDKECHNYCNTIDILCQKYIDKILKC